MPRLKFRCRRHCPKVEIHRDAIVALFLVPCWPRCDRQLLRNASADGRAARGIGT